MTKIFATDFGMFQKQRKNWFNETDAPLLEANLFVLEPPEQVSVIRKTDILAPCHPRSGSPQTGLSNIPAYSLSQIPKNSPVSHAKLSDRKSLRRRHDL